MTDAEFYRLTPRQLRYLMDRYRERNEARQYHSELIAGIIAATCANHSFCPPKKPLGPADYMPSEWRRKEKPVERVPKGPGRKLVAQQVRCFLLGRVAAQDGAA